MDLLSQTFAALSDPTRRAIVSRLAAGDATVGELARPFDISGPAISRHLKVLEEARLIERRVEARWRVCSLRRDRLAEARGPDDDRPEIEAIVGPRVFRWQALNARARNGVGRRAG